jgi:hypothetical protein
MADAATKRRWLIPQLFLLWAQQELFWRLEIDASPWNNIEFLPAHDPWCNDLPVRESTLFVAAWIMILQIFKLQGGEKKPHSIASSKFSSHTTTPSPSYTSSKNTQRYSLCVWIYATKASGKNTTEDHKSIRLRKGEKHSCSRQQLTKRTIQDALSRLNFRNVTYTNFLLASRRRRKRKQQQVPRKAHSVVVARKTRRRIARLEGLREWEITKCTGDDLLCL